ncbi:SCO family protein [Halosolutus gelatinilyticus]|uniref:SCO family protein n=1 Tax=Halosolutus gelatinilyticus TaxID=2931975 RepID=UPI001FF4812F|nr:SCO family protein [Halosolutus gelatinilyticus]
MERRTYLRSIGAAGVAGLAGCLGDAFGVGSDETVLDPPEENRGDPSHSVHGEEFPSFSLPDPLTGETVSLEDFVGERAFLMTYFFTSCPNGACPALLLRLRRVQEDAAQRGYEDDVGLLAMTFDPDRDTPEAIEQYAHEQGVDLEAGNWHFLRPESNEAAKQLLEEDFGMPIKQVEELPASSDGAKTDSSEESNSGDEGHGDHAGNESDGEHAGNESHEGQAGNESHEDNAGNETDHQTHDHGEYTFTHYNLIMLVNEDGIVERAYPNAFDDREAVSVETIVEDTRRVVEG